jgi:hypothetical protein
MAVHPAPSDEAASQRHPSQLAPTVSYSVRPLPGTPLDAAVGASPADCPVRQSPLTERGVLSGGGCSSGLLPSSFGSGEESRTMGVQSQGRGQEQAARSIVQACEWRYVQAGGEQRGSVEAGTGAEVATLVYVDRAGDQVADH